jgi:hypothetical protein
MSTPERAAGAERVDQSFFSETLADALARGEAVVLRVHGASMLPWLREGDKVRIRPAAGRPLHRGDIALFWRAPGRPILHRVVRILREEGICECLGDAESGDPERVPVSGVMGVAETTPLHRGIYRIVNPPRRLFNRLCLRWGLRLRHG